MKKIYLTILFATLFSFSSCLIVKEKDVVIKKEVPNILENSPKSSIKMSDKIIRSKNGDMVVSIPENWFFIEPGGSISSEVFAIAVNPEYTISAIFSNLRKSQEFTEVVEKEGLIGLSRLCYTKHNEKAINNINLVENPQIINLQQQKFGFYSFLKQKDNTFGNAAVFISSTGEYYEFALVTMDFTSNVSPTRTEFDKIFNSILTTLKY
jgi:hypothetical protein